MNAEYHGDRLRDRIPFLFAALLVAALIAVVGVAAFSITTSDEPEEDVAAGPVVSGRVASAILAASVSTVRQAAESGSIEALAPQSASEPSAVTTSTTAPAPDTSSEPPAPGPTATTDTTPPPLEITTPDDGATVTSSVVEFAGTSEPGAVVISGPFDADMEDDGDWSISLVVGSGYNGTVFTARDAAGNETSVRITVLYEKAPSPTTTGAPSPSPTTTSAPTPTTSPPPSSNCPVSGSCSSQWPADPKQAHGRDYWRSTVTQYWPADRVECVLDLIQRESGGDPQANNSGLYLGLMQHSYWAWNGRAEAIGLVDGNGLTAHPFNGAANIAAGAWLANRSSPWWQPWPPTTRIPSCEAIGVG